MDYLILGIAVMMWIKTNDSGGLDDSESRRRNIEMASIKLAERDNRVSSRLGIREVIPFCRSIDKDRKDD